MKVVKVLDKNFELFIDESKILSAIKLMAATMNLELKDKNPLLLCVLNGSFMFASDLMKQLTMDCEISFVKLASYEGTESSGQVKKLIGLNEQIKGRTVIIIEDIIDTGITIETLVQQVKAFEPAEIRIATLLFKPDVYKKDITLNYVGLEIPNVFIVGYGLDYNGYGRNLKDLYTVIN